MTEEHRDGCQCHGCVCSRYELEIHSLMNDIQHERETVAAKAAVIEKLKDELFAVLVQDMSALRAKAILESINTGPKQILAEYKIQIQADAFEQAAKVCETFDPHPNQWSESFEYTQQTTANACAEAIRQLGKEKV